MSGKKCCEGVSPRPNFRHPRSNFPLPEPLSPPPIATPTAPPAYISGPVHAIWAYLAVVPRGTHHSIALNAGFPMPRIGTIHPYPHTPSHPKI